MPLYRLEEIFARSGVEIPRSTTCGWMRQCAELLEPLYRRLSEEVLRCHHASHNQPRACISKPAGVMGA
jgi:transposase